MGELPLVRFHLSSVDKWTARLGQCFLRKFGSSGTASTPQNQHPPKRTAPFLHDFRYESLAFDLMGGYQSEGGSASAASGGGGGKGVAGQEAKTWGSDCAERPIELTTATFTYDTLTTAPSRCAR